MLKYIAAVYIGQVRMVEGTSKVYLEELYLVMIT